MNVVMIGGAFNDGDYLEGGIQSIVNTFASGFSRRSDIKLIVLGVDINYRKRKNIIFDTIPLPFSTLGRLLNYFLFPQRIINQIERKYSPDIYHFQGTIPDILLINDEIRKKTVLTPHGILEEEEKYQTTSLKRLKFKIKAYLEKKN